MRTADMFLSAYAGQANNCLAIKKVQKKEIMTMRVPSVTMLIAIVMGIGEDYDY